MWTAENIGGALTGVFFVATFLYPFWGFALLVLLCVKLATRGSLGLRMGWGLVVAALVTAIFTPVMWGTEGFGWFMPWPAVLLDRKHSIFWWPLAAAVFGTAWVINVANGKAE